IVVAAGSGDIQTVDVSDPMLPALIGTLDFDASSVEFADGILYAAAGAMLHGIDLATGQVSAMRAFDVAITDLEVAGGRVYAVTEDVLGIFQADAGALTPLGSYVFTTAGNGRNLFITGPIPHRGAA